MTFKEDLINNFIPRVEIMLQKEKKHLSYLIEKQNKLNKKKKWYYFISNNNLKEIHMMILESQYMVQHFSLRLEEYKNYSSIL